MLATAAAVAVEGVDDIRIQAQHELYAARYDHAVELYRTALKADPHWADGYDGLVRALLESHHSADAYEAADAAMQQAPGSAGALVAHARALYRKGELPLAEKAWHDALAIDPKSASALEGLARIQALVAHFKTAQVYRGMAFRLAPDDPELMVSSANRLKGVAHIDALRKVLAIYDPASQEAKSLRAHIADDEALGDTKLRTVKDLNRSYQVKLVELFDGPRRLRGFGIRVIFNGNRPATLLLDTGASGIALTPHLAEKFELRALGNEAREARGIGDREARGSFAFLAASVRIGELEIENFPVHVSDSFKGLDVDGLIGTDVFARFLVMIDFPNRALTLDPLPHATTKDSGEPEDAVAPPAGLFPVYRTGHMWRVPTFVNKEPAPHLFLIDSGAHSNLIDTSVARNSTKTSSDYRTVLKGVQGRVNEVSRANEGTLTFAGFRQQNPDLIAIDFTKQSDNSGLALDGILGFKVLINLKVTMDYHDNAIRFDYNAK